MWCCLALTDLVVTHALEWPSLTVQWLPVSGILPPAPLPCIFVHFRLDVKLQLWMRLFVGPYASGGLPTALNCA